VVAKIHYRGRVNRHLRGLRLDEEAGLPAAGTELHDADRSRGRVTTAARSPRLGAIALAYLHRSVEPGRRVAVGAGGDAGAEVVELPFGG
jgi:aminomethyltransferase